MSYRTEIGLVLLLAAALGVAILAGGRARRVTQLNEPVSTLRTGPSGGRAPYDVLARLGVPVERRRTPLFDLARQIRRRPAILAVVAPGHSLAPAEREAVAQFIESGGTLVAVGEAGGLTQCLGWETARPDSGGSHPDSASIAPPAGLYRLPPVTRVLRPVERDSTEAGTKGGRTGEGKRGGSRVLRELDNCSVAGRLATDTLVNTVGVEPVIVRERFQGGGRALLVADDAWFRNAAWRTS